MRDPCQLVYTLGACEPPQPPSSARPIAQSEAMTSRSAESTTDGLTRSWEAQGEVVVKRVRQP
jgi:hypothetical protein